MRNAVALALLFALVLALAACSSSGNTRAAEQPIAATDHGTTTTTIATTHTPSSTTPTTVRPRVTTDKLCAFRGLGTWVDVYDTEPAFQQPPGATPPVNADAISAMAQAGVHTLYLQVSKDDVRSPQLIANAEHASEFLTRAHAAHMKVVAWYLPKHLDPTQDEQRVLALANFRAHGQRFDGIALDIEGLDQKDVAVRNQRLVALMQTLDRVAGDRPVGAIVYPPVATEVINPTLWPDFPWRALAPHVDVWLPMDYWTFRTSTSQYRDAGRYTADNITRLRSDVGDAQLPVHVIGGVGDTATLSDYASFERAARAGRTIGASVYDYNTTVSSAWPLLRADKPAC
ncbi:MAG TPA: hypothetical protein VL856_15995 [Acidimicrobiia bacterium]|jgi:hypothetical protein|nr:hypothetical protein [Acidimicrobiia bacterium]